MGRASRGARRRLDPHRRVPTSELPSRIAALGLERPRRGVRARRHGPHACSMWISCGGRRVTLGADVLIGVQGSPPRAGHRPRASFRPCDGRAASAALHWRSPRELEPGFGPGFLVLGPDRARPRRRERRAPSAALAGFAVATRAGAAPRARRGRRPAARARVRRRPARASRRSSTASTARCQAHSTDLADDPVELPRQRPLARGDRAGAVRAPEHRALPPEARLAR